MCTGTSDRLESTRLVTAAHPSSTRQQQIQSCTQSDVYQSPGKRTQSVSLPPPAAQDSILVRSHRNLLPKQQDASAGAPKAASTPVMKLISGTLKCLHSIKKADMPKFSKAE